VQEGEREIWYAGPGAREKRSVRACVRQTHKTQSNDDDERERDIGRLALDLLTTLHTQRLSLIPLLLRLPRREQGEMRPADTKKERRKSR